MVIVVNSAQGALDGQIAHRRPMGCRCVRHLIGELGLLRRLSDDSKLQIRSVYRRSSKVYLDRGSWRLVCSSGVVVGRILPLQICVETLQVGRASG
jgi:hypothetical protein